VSAETLKEHCKAQLAYFEIPTLWRIDDVPLPTLAGEKLDKNAIKAAYVASRAEG
jgi:hypothetical protein